MAEVGVDDGLLKDFMNANRLGRLWSVLNEVSCKETSRNLGLLARVPFLADIFFIMTVCVVVYLEVLLW